MFFFQPLPFLILETCLFWFFVSEYGFLPVFAAYVVPSFLGMLVLSFQSRAALLNLQKRMAEGGQPGFPLLNAVAKFFAGLLLLAPFFTTRILGVALLLPGVRQLILFLAQGWLLAKLSKGLFQNGNFKVFMGGAGFQGARGTRGAQDFEEIPAEREVVDVTPLEIVHEDSKKPHRPQ